MDERERWIEQQVADYYPNTGLDSAEFRTALRDAMSFADRQREERVAELERQLKVWENEPCPECGEHHQCGAIARLKELEGGFHA